MLRPKASVFLILAAVAVFAFAIIGWWLSREAAPPSGLGEQNAVAPRKKDPPPDVPVPPFPAPSGSGRGAPEIALDPGLREQADRLHDENEPPLRDLELLSEFLRVYSRAFSGNPVGDNADITAALTGQEGHKGRVFPPGHRTIVNGQMVDRWGTPYWFHPNSSAQMEIRSAGPDRQLFTLDDVVHGASPPGLGATPSETGPSPDSAP